MTDSPFYVFFKLGIISSHSLPIHFVAYRIPGSICLPQ